ncbi:MAG: lysoplasmalogenase [Clostridia bacterium]
MVYAFLVVGLLVSASFIIVRDKNGGAVPLFLKTFSSILFLLVCALGYLTNPNPDAIPKAYFVFMIIGMSFALIGDILLDLKITYPQDNDTYTYGGMSAFACCHIFYYMATLKKFDFNFIPLVVAVASAIAMMLVVKYVMKLKLGKFVWISLIYSGCLALTFFQTCFIAYKLHFNAYSIVFAIGALLFLLSDVILSMTYFDGKDSKIYIVINHSLYYCGQFLIALSMFLLV